MSRTETQVRPPTLPPDPGTRVSSAPGSRRGWWTGVLSIAVLYVIYRLTPDRDRPVARAGAPARAAVAGEGRRGGERPDRGLRWWREILYILAFYLIYSVIRNTQGSAAVSVGHAMGNALEIIRLERALGLYHEQAVQHAFLGSRMFIEFWNLFYGSFHFVVTAAALVLLFRRFPARYRRWRNTLAFATTFALIGYATYPLMPPRLLPASYGYVDTLKTFGSLWSFDSGAVAKVSNQYAAMPSLHFAWATWCALVLVPLARSWWAKALAAVYPLCTLFAIVVTANHFVLDGAGGLVVLGAGVAIGFPLAARVERQVSARLARMPATTVAATTVGAVA